MAAPLTHSPPSPWSSTVMVGQGGGGGGGDELLTGDDMMDEDYFNKRQRVYMSPRVWAELDADPQRGLAMLDALQQQEYQQHHQQQQQAQHQELMMRMRQSQAQQQGQGGGGGGLPAQVYTQMQFQQQHQQQQQPFRPLPSPQAQAQAAAAAAMMVMDQQQGGGGTDDDVSQYFYVSPPEQQEGQPPAPAAATSTHQPSQGQASSSQLDPTHTHTHTQTRAATTDDLASVYRPLLMTGTTPNSTSSIFCRNTVCNPDADQIILCMSSVLQVQMLHDKDAAADPARREIFKCFEAPVQHAQTQTFTLGQSGGGGGTTTVVTMGVDERMYQQHPQQYQNIHLHHPQPPPPHEAQTQAQALEEEEEVTVEEIHHFIEDIFKRAGFSPECNIIALVYINRVISTTALPLHTKNWKAIVLVALLLAQKVWDDRSVALSSFSHHLPEFPPERMRLVERKFLELLQYRATVTQALYTRYYFELRALFEKLLEQEHISREFPLKPMALWQARKLELCSDSFGLCQRPSGGGMRGGSNSNGGSGSVNMNVHGSASSSSSSSSSSRGAAAGSGGGNTRVGGFPQPHSPLTPFSTSTGPLSSTTAALPRPHPQSNPNPRPLPPSSVLSTTSSTTSTASSLRRASLARLSPWSPSPQSPSPTYEDVTYQPKGRYVQS